MGEGAYPLLTQSGNRQITTLKLELGNYCEALKPLKRLAPSACANGTIFAASRLIVSNHKDGWFREAFMNGLIYLIGLIVVIMAILSFLGLR